MVKRLGVSVLNRRTKRVACFLLLMVQAIACSNLVTEPRRIPQAEMVRFGDATWSGRDSFGTALLPGAPDSLMVFGGFTPARSNEQWISKDLIQWTEVPITQRTPSPRNGHCLVSSGKKVFLIGGYTGTTFLNDVYSATDGREWQKHADAGFSPRAFFGCVFFDDMIWVFGGNVADGLAANDVWRSEDGLMWEQVSSNSAWNPRGMFAHFVLNGRMWIVGGGIYDSRYLANVERNYRDAWSSADGVTWKSSPMPEGFSPRRFMGATSVGGVAFLVGGFELDRRLFTEQRFGILRESPSVPDIFRNDPQTAGREYGNLNEVWITANGKDWSQVEVPASFRPRHAPGVVAHGNNAVILGGFGSELYNDIWIARQLRD